MSGGGDTTTNSTTNTGLGDKQYKGLTAQGAAGQKALTNTIVTQANQNEKKIGTTAAQTQQVVKNNAAQTNKNLASGFADVNTGMDAGFTGVNDGLASGFADTGQSLDNLSTQVGDVQTGVNEGFAATNNNLGVVNDNVNTGFAGLGDLVSGGFASQAQADQIQAQAQAAGFTNLTDLLNSGFGGAAAQLTEAQRQILSGQTGLNEALVENRNRLDTFYGGLAEGQASIGEQVGGLQTDFSNFNTGYNQDVTIANAARADLQSGMEGGFASTKAAIGDSTQAVADGQQRLMSAVGGNSVAQNAAQAATGFSAPPQANTNPAQATSTQLSQLLTSAYDAALNPNVDPALRQRFGVIASSFNEQGQLIPNSTLSDGSTVIRQIDGQGNLRFKTIASNGAGLSSGAINVADTFGILKNLQSTSGGFGFSTPYSQTM